MSDFTSTLYSYDYFLTDGLFKNLSVPDGIDKNVLISVILLECGEMQPIWTNPLFMQEMIGMWSTKWYHTFEKWVNALSTDYEPLNNYDRYEDINEEHSNIIKNSATSKTGAIGENLKSAYDSPNYTPYDKSISNGDTSDNSNSNDDGTFKHTAHMYGNIGVTTSQQMLKDELEVSKWNIYNHIKDLFMQDFCIMIY